MTLPTWRHYNQMMEMDVVPRMHTSALALGLHCCCFLIFVIFILQWPKQPFGSIMPGGFIKSVNHKINSGETNVNITS